MRDDQLFVLDTARGAPREITGRSTPRLSSNAWSADGRHIAYLALPNFDLDSAPRYRFEIRVVDMDGSHDRRLIALDGCCDTPFVGVAGGWVDPPVWSPNGDRVAFVSTAIACPTWGVCAAQSTLYIVGSDGTGLLPVAVDVTGIEEPSWSPDGSRLAYTSTSGGVQVVRTSGSSVPRRVSPPDVIARSPVWAPNGERIAFLAVPVTDVIRYVADVWVTSPDGPHARMLPVTTGDPVSWSPDSRAIAFGDDGIKTISVDGSKVRRLTPSPPADWYEHLPRWSADGTRIAYSKTGPRRDPGTLWMVRVDSSSRPRQLAWGTGYSAQFSWAPR